MRLARIATPAGPRPVMMDADRWHVVEDFFVSQPRRTGESYPVQGTRLLAPVEPRVVLGMAHNGAPEDRELAPQAFMKSARTVVGPHDPIRIDTSLGRVNGEGELALVVGRETRNVSPDEARACVLGWTIGNDVSAIDQAHDQYALQVKSGDGFTPLGPWIETELPQVLASTMTVFRNGEQLATASTAQLAWNPHEALSHLSRYLTLGPGDIILTGAPGTFFPIAPGDQCRCEIEGIGALENPVVDLGAIA